MILSLSGTPGTGKTCVARELDTRLFTVVSMNHLSAAYVTGHDPDRGSREVDVALMVRDIREGRLSLTSAGAGGIPPPTLPTGVPEGVPAGGAKGVPDGVPEVVPGGGPEGGCGHHTIIEGHLSHNLPADIIVVLRTSVPVLRGRLEERGYPREKVLENLEAEALGVITLEALDTGQPVYEIDTSVMNPAEVARRCEAIIRERPAPLSDPANMIDLTEGILSWY